MKVIWVVAMSLIFMVACKKEGYTPVEQPDTTIPTLSNSLASFANLNRFIPYGERLMNGDINDGYRIHIADTGQSLLAACTGIVTAINDEPEGQHTVVVKFKPNSIYTFLYTGIGLVKVAVNDSVYGGSILGKISPKGIIGFTIVRNGQPLCPQGYGSSSFNTSIDFAISQHNALHPDEAVSSPCLVDELP